MKISVILPVYNREEYISQAVLSILDQSFKDFELIIIDDGSTDNTWKILLEFAKKDKRIELIQLKKNRGIVHSVNLGIKKAKGKYLARMDADDVSLRTRLEKQFSFLEKNKDVFLCGTSYYITDENLNITEKVNCITDSKKINKAIKNENVISNPSIMYRSAPRYLYREKFVYTEDYDFILRMVSDKKKLSSLKDYLLLKRMHKNAISIDKKGYQILFREKAKEFYFEREKFKKDSYGSFNPSELVSLDIAKVIDKEVIKGIAYSKFSMNDSPGCRKEIYRYIRNFSLDREIILLLIFTIIPKRILNYIRKAKN